MNTATSPAQPRYRDAEAPIEVRVADLLERMTLEEKVAQLTQLPGWTAYDRSAGALALGHGWRERIAGGLGAIYGLARADPWTGVSFGHGLSPREATEVSAALQRVALEETRLGIPLLIGIDGSHGLQALDATVFPTGLSVASTWNPALVRRVGAAIGAEARAIGAHITYCPVLDIARDPRWGRTEETFGEDPELVARLGEAMVRGLQGASLAESDAVIATVKHFAGHGAGQGGRNSAPLSSGPREFRSVWLKPFEAALRAGAGSVMPAYSEVDGLPCSANRWLLDTLLRGEYGFEGFVVSDMGALAMLHRVHRVAASFEAAAQAALTAGVDLELNATLEGGVYAAGVRRAVLAGEIPEASLNRAVGRLLRAKFALGLFEQPYPDPARSEVVGCPAHRELALEVARQGVVLLKNDGVLPIARGLRRVAVIGPNADHVYNQIGDYVAPQRRAAVTTVLEALRLKLGDTVVSHARGCGVRDSSTAGIAEAVGLARGSDLAVLVLGGSSARDFGADAHDPLTGAAVVRAEAEAEMDSGEGFDRAGLGLLGAQQALLEAVRATGTPVVLVLINGRPLSLEWASEHVPAILEAWYPGAQGGTAIAEVLLGEVNPAGRLPISVPRSVGQLPAHYDRKPTAAGKRYVEMDSGPLYAFGHGLSYTRFAYADLEVSPPRIQAGASCTVEVTVSNIGGRTGDEVVQLYLRDEYASVTVPVCALCGFERVRLAPEESRRVRFALGFEALSLWNAQLERVVEPGEFTVWVGGDLHGALSARFEVIA